jgi:hypothetical protein
MELHSRYRILFAGIVCLFAVADAGAFVDSTSVQFICGELLGRPGDRSIAVNICADKDIEWYVEYGTTPGNYSGQTTHATASHHVPSTIDLNGLQADTRYFYRVRYRETGASDDLARPEHSFTTARSRGRSFSFAIEADPHLDTSTNVLLYRRTLGNILRSGADFLLDLGDTFMADKLPLINRQEITKRHLLFRSFIDTLGHSIPLLLVQGNHDGELGWFVNGTPENLAVWAANIRLSYYPGPLPGSFYTGDTSSIMFVGRRQNYYAWEWGSALFVVLDVYWYTAKKPGSSKDNWDWTLGKEQYDWLKRTLEKSSAPFKFVFAHQVVGGNDLEGRGGIEAAPYYEMGGLNSDGSSGFAAHRPGWEMPIHQLMVKNGVSVFFHGHDHVFVKQDMDGMVYHELPQPAYFNFSNPAKSYNNTNIAAAYGYTHGTVLSSSGFMKVTVSDTSARVEYIRSYLPEHENAQQINGTTAHSYTIQRSVTSVTGDRGQSSVDQFILRQNYPNPFNPTTTINYTVPQAGTVTLTVYNQVGQEIKKVVSTLQTAGEHSLQFDGSAFSSGVYFYRLSSGSVNLVKKMTLIR